MPEYLIREVDASDPNVAMKIRALNRRAPECFPELRRHHLHKGFWWFACHGSKIVAFAGLVPFVPFPNIGYLKRAYVVPAARGNGLQRQFLREREQKARALGWMHLVSECNAGNIFSANNFLACGFDLCDPEQPWGPPDSIYWVKRL
jgi:GNAT superfamily N-acetyltransferase